MTLPLSRTNARPESAFSRFWDDFQQAEQQAKSIHHHECHRLDMQGIRVLVTSIGQGLAHILLPALGHLVVQPPTEITADVSFTLCDTAITAIQPPAPPFQPADYHRYGQRAVYTDENLSILHAPTTDMLLAYDRRLRYGICWVKDAAALSIYDRAAPLQTHFHWALRDHGWQVVHAAAIGRADGGVLLIGNSGAGKSTTAFSALKSGRLRYLSDDKCLVRLAPEPATSTLFCSAKIKEDILDEFPEFRPFIAGRDDESKVGKHLAFLYPHFRRGMIDSFPLRAIIIPRIRHLQEPALTPAGAGDAFRVLGPSTAIWLPGAEADSYHFLGQLVRQLPCYFLDLAFPPHANLSAIAELLDRYRVFSHPPK